ncbi:MAG: hypothetical protein L3J37_07450 [Rhodobacteraceae bacterium]|nr:hypothetical protein [Paracoccaceae bacterium]
MIFRGVFLAAFFALPLSAQEDEDGVIRSCLAKDNTTEVCICASLVLKARVGEQPYARFGEIEDRLVALREGAEADDGEEMALLGEGYPYFVPHGQAISVCTKKISAGE